MSKRVFRQAFPTRKTAPATSKMARIARGISTAFKVGRAAYGMYNSYKSRSNKSTSNTNFNGHFRKVQWKKPRRNYKKVRRYRRFARKVNAVINAGSEKAHFVVQRSLRVQAPPGKSACNELVIQANNDLLEARRKCVFNTSSDGGFDLDKLHVNNVVCDMYMTNPTNVCVYADVYEIYAKPVGSGANFNSPLTWIAHIDNSDTINNLGQGASSQFREAPTSDNLGVFQIGSSLFQCSPFFSKFKIYKKTRSLLQPGECMTKQFRYSKDWVWDPKKYLSDSNTGGFVFPVAQTESIPPVQVNVVSSGHQLVQPLNNKRTKWLVLQIWGQPINSEVSKSSITTTGAALNIVYTIDYTIRQVPLVRQAQVKASNVWVQGQYPVITDGRIVQEYEAPVATPFDA